MLPTRFVPGQAPRKSRMEGRQSFLPRRVVSTDRLADSRRPSGTGPRSSSPEPARASVAVGRQSREASATKLPIKRRSRSQQGSRYEQPTTSSLRNIQNPTTAPVRSRSQQGSRYEQPTTSSLRNIQNPTTAAVRSRSQQGSRYEQPTTSSLRNIQNPTTAPVRSRSQQGSRYEQPTTSSLRNIQNPTTAAVRSRSQQGSRYEQPTTSSLRNIQNPTTAAVSTLSGDRSRGWEESLQRALNCVTVKDQRPIATIAWQRACLSRVQEALAARGEPDAAQIRPLTVARFVDIVGALLRAITGTDNLNNDNYVTKLPRMCKRLLYPGTVSKSWLQKVNTPQAFPQALALISYLVDLLRRIEAPVSDERLYVENDEISQLRRGHLQKCFIRFQEPDAEYDDLTVEYLLQLKQLIGSDGEKIRELNVAIKQQERALAKEMRSSARARATEAGLVARRQALVASLRASRLNVQSGRAALDAARAAARDKAAELEAVDAEIARATAESAQLANDLDSQCISVETRVLLQKADNAARLSESARVRADQVAQMVHNRETELELWQMKILSSCLEYKRGLIHLSAKFPQLAALDLDETQLEEPSGPAAVRSALAALQQFGQRAQRQAKLEEARAAVAELKSKIAAAKQECEASEAAAAAEEAAAARRAAEVAAKLQEYREKEEEFKKVHDELLFWKKQEEAWQTKLAAMREYIKTLKEKLPKMLQDAFKARADLVARNLQQWEPYFRKQ